MLRMASMSNPAMDARLLCGMESDVEAADEAEAVVQTEALLSLGGMEKPAVDETSARLGVWKPHVAGVMDIPLGEEAEAVDCMGEEVGPVAVLAKAPSAPTELGTELGECA